MAIVVEDNRFRRLEPKILVLTNRDKEQLKAPWSMDMMKHKFSIAPDSVRILRGPEGDLRRARLFANVAHFAAGLRRLGLPAEAQSAIFPVVLGTPERALAASARLRRLGLLVKPIRPPTVPAGTSRLRFALSSEHQAAHLDAALDGLRAVL